YKKSAPVHSKLTAGLAGVAALALFTACTAEEPTQDDQPADQQTEQQEASAPADDQNTTTSTETDDQTQSTDDAATDENTTSGNDEVYSIIEAVESEYNDGFIVDIDRDDNGSTFEVDVVAENQVYQLDVAADGTINVDETDSDD